MKKRISLISLILIIALVLASTIVAYGASASTSISGGGTYTKGSTVKITYKYSGDSVASITTNATYNSSVLKYVSYSGSGMASGSSGVVRVSSSDGSDHKSMSITLTFTAIATGKSSVKFNTTEVTNIDGIPLSVSDKSTTVTVNNPAPTVSSNANLSSLKVSAGSLSPAFSPSVTSYSVNVGKDVSVCTISATAADDDATITVSGSKNLTEGKNIRKVTVTAANGKTKTYTITINKSSTAAKPEDPNEPDESDKPEDEETPVVEKITTTVGETEFVVREDIQPSDIPNGFALSMAKYDEYDIPVIKDNKYKYTLALLENFETGDATWFFYDEADNRFRIKNSLTSDEIFAFYTDEPSNPTKEGIVITKEIMILLGALLGTLGIFIIVIIILQCKILKANKQRKKNLAARKAAIAEYYENIERDQE